MLREEKDYFRYGFLCLVFLGALLLAASVLSVVLKDREGPVITVPEEEVLYGEEEAEESLLAGVRAVDKRDGDVSDTVIIESMIPMYDGSRAKIIYAAKDRSNNITKAERMVSCKDTSSEGVDKETAAGGSFAPDGFRDGEEGRAQGEESREAASPGPNGQQGPGSEDQPDEAGEGTDRGAGDQQEAADHEEAGRAVEDQDEQNRERTDQEGQNLAAEQGGADQTAAQEEPDQTAPAQEGPDQAGPAQELPDLAAGQENQAAAQPAGLNAFNITPGIVAEENLPVGQRTGAPSIALNTHHITSYAGDAVNRYAYIASASDDKDNAWARVRVDGELDINVPGTYELSYYVIDSDGNSSNVEKLTVKVIER